MGHKKCKRHGRKKCCYCVKQRCDDCCPRFVDCYPTRCGFVSYTLVVTATPMTYTAAGTIITLTYTITNTGTKLMNGPMRIHDTILGTQCIGDLCLYPGTSRAYTRMYMITTADFVNPSVTFTGVGLYEVCDCVYIRQTSTVTVTKLIV